MPNIITSTGSFADSAALETLLNAKANSSDVNLTFRGFLNIADASPTLPGIYMPTEEGTYPNAGNINISFSSGFSAIGFDGTNYFKQVNSLSLSPYALKAEVGFPVWTNGNYSVGTKRSYLGRFWKANAAIISGEIPGTSPKWSEELTSYVSIDKLNKEIYGDYYIFKNTYMRNNGVYTSLASYDCTSFIPFVNGSTLVALGTSGGGSFYRATFFDANFTINGYFNPGSSVEILSINSSNTPPNTAFVVLNSASSTEATRYVYVNSVKSIKERLVSLEAATDVLNSNTRNLTGQFTDVGYRNLAGVLTSNTSYRSTPLIPFTELDTVFALKTTKGASLADINFYDVNKAVLSYYQKPSNLMILKYSPGNIPAGTKYISLNSLSSDMPDLRINRITDLHNLSKHQVLHQLFGKKWVSYGDSITEAGYYQSIVVEILGCNSEVRGCGSSSVTANFFGMAVKPDGKYIDRRQNYTSDTDFTTALVSAGYTNLVTSPTWIDYSNNPTGYTLPANSYFIINTQASHQERINTIPTDADVITVLYGTNDEKNNAFIGSINDYGDGAGGLAKNFIGSYRLMLKKIKLRAPKAKIILIIPLKKESEYDYINNIRTSEGEIFDNFRSAILSIGSNYGYEVIDASKALNFDNIRDQLADGIHPNQIGYRTLGEMISFKLSNINISLVTG